MTRPRHPLALALALLASDCTPPPGCAGALCLDLAGATHVRVGFAADSAELVDVDGDGHLDLVTAGHDAGTLSVVWGSADMFAGTATTWSIAPAIRGLAVADLDGDGRLDLATTVPDSDALAVLTGLGAREFTPPTQHPLGPRPRDLLAADLDHTGPAELVVVHEDGALHVVRDFIAGPAIPLDAEPHDLALGDLDGDGHLDLALAFPEAAALQLLLGDGAGDFTPGPKIPVGAAPRAVEIADLDGDGRLDLAATDVLADVVHVLLGDGHGGVRDRLAWPTAPAPGTLVVASRAPELPVLVVMSAETGLMQQIDPRTGETLSGALREQRPQILVRGDITGDGLDEIVHVDDSSYGRVGLFTPDTGLMLESAWPAPAAGPAFPVALDDDRDGLVLGLSPQPPGEVSAEALVVAIASGPDQLSAPFASGLDAPPRGALAVDLTGDGRRELVLWDPGAIAVHERLPDGSLAPPITLKPGTSGTILAGDVDDDGRTELLLTATPNRLRAIAPFAQQTTVLDVPLDDMPNAMTLRDADGDGDLDLVLRNVNRVHVYPRMRIADPPLTSMLDQLVNISALEILDLERDGEPDVFACHVLGFARYPNFFSQAPGEAEHLDDASCFTLAATDLDGDGADELLTAGANGSGHIVLTPWRSTGDGLTPLGSQTVPATPELARLAGGPARDLLVPRPDGRVEIIKMSLGPGLSAATRHALGPTLGLQLADVDGDDVLDLVGFGSSIGLARGDAHGFGPLHRIALDRVRPGARAISSAALGDLDDDGAVEAVVSLHLDGLANYELATLDFADTSITQLAEPGPSPHRLAFSDFDGDGQRDLLSLTGATTITSEILFGEPITLDLAFFRGRPGNSFDAPQVSQIDSTGAPTTLQLADLDGDRHLDLISVRNGISAHRGRGDGSFGPLENWSPAVASQIAVGDLDRDGHRDVVATLTGRPASAGAVIWPSGGRRNDLAILRGGGARSLGPPEVVLTDATTMALTDLDMDGDLDIIAAGPGVLHIGTNEAPGGLRWTHHDLPVVTPGGIRLHDLDGDALLDLVLFERDGLTLVRQLP